MRKKASACLVNSIFPPVGPVAALICWLVALSPYIALFGYVSFKDYQRQQGIVLAEEARRAIGKQTWQDTGYQPVIPGASAECYIKGPGNVICS